MDMHIFSFPSENKTWTLNDLHDSEESPVSVRFGGPSRTRTDNIFLAKEALYHWSYRPIFYSLLVYFTNSEGRGNRTHSVETTSLQPAPALQLRRTHKAFFGPGRLFLWSALCFSLLHATYPFEFRWLSLWRTYQPSASRAQLVRIVGVEPTQSKHRIYSPARLSNSGVSTKRFSHPKVLPESLTQPANCSLYWKSHLQRSRGTLTRLVVQRQLANSVTQAGVEPARTKVLQTWKVCCQCQHSHCALNRARTAFYRSPPSPFS